MKILTASKTTLSLLIAGSLGSCFFIYLTTKVYLKRKQYRHLKGPKTHGLSGFYFGNLAELNEARKKNVPFPHKLLEWKQIYGPIFKVQFMNDILVSVNDPEAIKKIVIDKNLPKYEYLYNFLAYSFGTRMLGKGLVTQTDNEKWKKKRSAFNHGFQRSFLMNSLKEFNDNSNFLMEKLRTMADGKTKIVLANEINRMALDIIANVAFGINTNSLTAKSSYLNTAITQLLGFLNDLFDDPLIVYNPFKRDKVKGARKVIKELRDYARQHIMQRIKDIQNKEAIPNDILSVIINNPDDQIELEELVDDFMTFFIAGQETTANSLSFSVLELGLNKEVFEKARKEVDEVVGARPIITYEEIAKLEYISCVFKETLRKWPPGGEFSRFTDQDLDLNGTIIPRNSWIVLSPYAMGRSEEFFPNPDKFEPERFLKDSKENELNKITSYTYFPFSIGPRNCIGQNFAQLEAKIMLVKFIQNFDFKLDPEQSFEPLELLTLRPKDGCRVFLMPRYS